MWTPSYHLCVCEVDSRRKFDNAPPGNRPSLKDIEEKETLEVASKVCTTWDGGAQLPPLNKYLTYGGGTPSIESVIKESHEFIDQRM